MFSITTLFFTSHLILLMGLFSFISSRDNIFIMFILAELLNLTSILNYIIFFYAFQNAAGLALIFIFFALTAAEAAIGLVLIINFIKVQNTLSIIY